MVIKGDTWGKSNRLFISYIHNERILAESLSPYLNATGFQKYLLDKQVIKHTISI